MTGEGSTPKAETQPMRPSGDPPLQGKPVLVGQHRFDQLLPVLRDNIHDTLKLIPVEPLPDKQLAAVAHDWWAIALLSRLFLT